VVEKQTMGMDIAGAKLEVLRAFIDFVNRQVGVYSDCLAGFQGNVVRVERQVARVSRPTAHRMENGQPVVMWASVEDSARPDIIHHRIIRADEFINVNSERGFNEQQVCWSIIVFIFAYWDEEIRPRIAAIRGVKPNDILIDALGDLRTLRKSIIHNGGVLTAAEYAKLRLLKDMCEPGAAISPSHDQMHHIFVLVKQAIAALILEYTGHLPGAPKVGEIVDIAIQNVRKP
jgi:hypothetical protein